MPSYLSAFQLTANPFPEISGDIAEKDFLSESEVGAYIDNCLKQAGKEDPLFEASSLPVIYAYTKGDPKLIHTICDFALHRAFFTNQATIHQDLLSDCMELILESKPPDTYDDERRRHKRVITDLPGTFHIQGTKTRGMMTVSNISRAGLQLKLPRQRMLKVKDRINLSFKLNDPEQSDIRTAVMVRHTFGFYAGCVFRHTDNNTFNTYLDNLLDAAEKKWTGITIGS